MNLLVNTFQQEIFIDKLFETSLSNSLVSFGSMILGEFMKHDQKHVECRLVQFSIHSVAELSHRRYNVEFQISDVNIREKVDHIIQQKLFKTKNI